MRTVPSKKNVKALWRILSIHQKRKKNIINPGIHRTTLEPSNHGQSCPSHLQFLLLHYFEANPRCQQIRQFFQAYYSKRMVSFCLHLCPQNQCFWWLTPSPYSHLEAVTSTVTIQCTMWTELLKTLPRYTELDFIWELMTSIYPSILKILWLLYANLHLGPVLIHYPNWDHIIQHQGRHTD